MHPALYGPNRDTADLSGLFIRQALSRNQNQGFTMLWRKFCECLAQVLEITSGTLIRGRAKLARIGPIRVRNFVLGPPALGVEEVAQDREQPRAHVRARLERLDVGQGAHDGVLHEVVGMIRAVGQRQREGSQARQCPEQGLTHLRSEIAWGGVRVPLARACLGSVVSFTSVWSAPMAHLTECPRG